MKLVVAAIAASALASVSPSAMAYRVEPGVIRIAIYRGPASCEDCSEAMARAIANLGGRYRAEYVGPREQVDITPRSLSHYQIYIQPGGGQDIDAALDAIGPRRVATIRRFVSNGGGYLGVCMGAYLAGASDIGLIGDDLDSEVQRPGSSAATIADGIVPVRWSGRQATLYYQDGPFLPRSSTDHGYRAIATYANGDIAAARYTLGKGTVVLSGPHPEADASWFDDARLPLSTMPRGTPLNDLLVQLRT